MIDILKGRKMRDLQLDLYMQLGAQELPWKHAPKLPQAIDQLEVLGVMSIPSSKLSYHVLCSIKIYMICQTFQMGKWVGIKFKQTCRLWWNSGGFSFPLLFCEEGCFGEGGKGLGKVTMVNKIDSSPFKISTYTTLFNLLQHLEPKVEDFSRNTQLLQYA